MSNIYFRNKIFFVTLSLVGFRISPVLVRLPSFVTCPPFRGPRTVEVVVAGLVPSWRSPFPFFSFPINENHPNQELINLAKNDDDAPPIVCIEAPSGTASRTFFPKKIILPFLIAGVVFLITAVSHAAIPAVTGTKISDGDTIQVVTPEQTKLRVLLYGIDAPETSRIDAHSDHFLNFSFLGFIRILFLL